MLDKIKDKDISVAGSFVSIAPRKKKEGYTLKFVPAETEKGKIDEMLNLSLGGTPVSIVVKVPSSKSSEKKAVDKKGKGKDKNSKR